MLKSKKILNSFISAVYIINSLDVIKKNNFMPVQFSIHLTVITATTKIVEVSLKLFEMG